MRHVRRSLTIAAAAAALAAMPLSNPALGVETPFGGYTMTSNVAGAGMFYDQPSLSLPAGATVELAFVRSAAQIEAGPAGYALASWLWPGSLAANVPPVIREQLVANGMQDQYGPIPVPQFPAYPVRAETFFPQGPATERNEMGSVSMRARAMENDSLAESSTNAITLPGVMTARQMATSAAAVIEGKLGVSRASSSISGLSILDGLITVDTVETRGEVRTDGTTAVASGGLEISGLRILGRDATIDDTGIHVPDQEIGPYPSTKVVTDALSAAGVSLGIARPIDEKSGASARRSIGGLVVTFDGKSLNTLYTAIAPLVAALPGDIRSAVESQMNADQDVSIVVGGLTVAAGAVPAYVYTPPPLPPFNGGGTTGSIAPPPTFVPGDIPTDPGSVVAPPATGGAPVIGGVPVAVVGVPGGVAFLGILVAGALALALRRLADRLVVAPGGGAPCPLEEHGR